MNRDRVCCLECLLRSGSGIDWQWTEMPSWAGRMGNGFTRARMPRCSHTRQDEAKPGGDAFLNLFSRRKVCQNIITNYRQKEVIFLQWWVCSFKKRLVAAKARLPAAHTCAISTQINFTRLTIFFARPFAGFFCNAACAICKHFCKTMTSTTRKKT